MTAAQMAHDDQPVEVNLPLQPTQVFVYLYCYDDAAAIVLGYTINRTKTQ